jgi:hypothetical protein
VKDANGDLVIAHKNTIEKRAEIDPAAAAWIVGGAEMMAREGKARSRWRGFSTSRKSAGRERERQVTARAVRPGA